MNKNYSHVYNASTSQLVTAQSLVFSTSMAAAEMILQHHHWLSSVNFTFHEFRHLLSFAVYKIIPVSGPVYVYVCVGSFEVSSRNHVRATADIQVNRGKAPAAWGRGGSEAERETLNDLEAAYSFTLVELQVWYFWYFLYCNTLSMVYKRRLVFSVKLYLLLLKSD